MLPEALEGLGPFVQRADGGGVGAIQHLPALAASADESDGAQHPEMLGHGGLRQAQVDHDVANRTLLESEIAQDLAAARLGNGVEGVGGRGGARHEEEVIFL